MLNVVTDKSELKYLMTLITDVRFMIFSS